jgi:hypothetical protein
MIETGLATRATPESAGTRAYGAAASLLQGLGTAPGADAEACAGAPAEGGSVDWAGDADVSQKRRAVRRVSGSTSVLKGSRGRRRSGHQASTAYQRALT